MNIQQKLTSTSIVAIWLYALTSAHAAPPFADLSFAAASKQAAESGKIVLVDFYTTWCGPCKLLDKNTWTDPAVIQLLEQKTVALRIDAEKEVALAKRYKIEAYPSVLLIKPDGTEIDRLVGYKEPKAFMDDFNAALAGKDSLSRAKDKVVAAGTNDPSARMQLGVTLAQKGRDAEALAEYLWCFDRGAEVSPGFVGVRVSFLLMNIKNLAAHYPPALQALELRRDACQAKAAAGSTDFRTIQDLIALNQALDEKEKNLAVFDHLPAESETRALISRLLMDQLLEAKRYADILHGTDGKPAFGKALDRYNLSSNSLPKGNPMKAQLEESMRQFTIAEA